MMTCEPSGRLTHVRNPDGVRSVDPADGDGMMHVDERVPNILVRRGTAFATGLLVAMAAACGSTPQDATAAALPTSSGSTSPEDTPSRDADGAARPLESTSSPREVQTPVPLAVSPTAVELVPSPTPPVVPVTADEDIRGIWIHLFDSTLKTPASIDAMLDEAAANGVNTIIAEVVRRNDAYYTSDVLPRTNDPTIARDFDMVEHIVAGAHARGMQLHAWMPLAPAWHTVYQDIPPPPGWVWTEHGPGTAAPWINRRHNGDWGEYLDLGVPAVQDHVVAVLTEIAERYDVDAIHLDYLRYSAKDMGYNPATLADFAVKTGRSDVPAPDDRQFTEFRRNTLTDLLRRIRTSVTTASPGTRISGAVIAQGEGPHEGFSFQQTRGYASYYQDWEAWLREGLLDEAMPMMYFREASHAEWFDHWESYVDALAAQVDAKIAPGLGAWLNSIPESVAQFNEATVGADGVMLYSYQQTQRTGPTNGLLTHLGQTAWKR